MHTALLYREPAAHSFHRLENCFEISSALSFLDPADLWSPLQEPRWRSRVEQRIHELSWLRSGWDGYGAERINQSVLSFALAVLDSVMAAKTPAPSLVPTHGGGLQLEWHFGGTDIELMIYRPFEAELNIGFGDATPPIEDKPLSTDFSDLSSALGEIV